MDKTVEREFSRFERKGITKKAIEQTWEKCCQYNLAHGENLFKRYKVINSKVYGEDTRLKRLLEALTKKYRVPDVDFIYFYHDRIPQHFCALRSKCKKAPILVSVKERNLNKFVLFIDWYYDVTEIEAGWNFLIQSLNQNQEMWPWEEKIERAFWRGSPADARYTWETLVNYPRGRLVYESKKNAELIDAAFINFHPWQVDDVEVFSKELGAAPFVSPVEHLKYKYQLDVDGTTATFPAAQWKLLSGCLLIKQKTDDIMWFYDELIPWVHYVPVHTDLRDLPEKIEWARKNDREAQNIAKNAREFALTHLMPEHILLFCYKTLLKYASLQKFKPEVTKKEKLENVSFEVPCEKTSYSR